ncbi:MAG: Trm112 family protein, partial [Candidatus Aminicenantes bacterium]|nr:Trm112 family protein [Candidatus Aminicenantes bacterium]
MPISKDLLDILACPKCKGDITLNKAGDGLICKACHLLYQIKDDIPVMLIDEALPYLINFRLAHMLFHGSSRVKEGSTILVHGGSGGMGSM